MSDMLTNDERIEVLEEFTSIYGRVGLDEIKEHMPTELNDPEGSEFETYFDFIQLLFSLRSDVKTFTNDQLDERLELIESLAQKYEYPTNTLEVFHGYR